MTFEAARDIRIEASQADDGTFTLVSRGLHDRRLPELAIVGVPDQAQARNAAVVINQVANYMANEKPIAAGERVGITSPNGSLIVRLMTSANAKVLRIEEPLDEMEPLKTMLSTVMLWKAMAAREAGDEARAVEMLEESIAYFPGDPARRDAPSFGVLHNWENYLAYRLLAQTSDDQDQAVIALERALERSASFEREQLGDPASALAKLDTANLTARARAILLVNDDSTQRQEINEHVCVVSSPIWRRSAESKSAERRMTVVPREHVYSAAPLLAEAALLATAVELVAAHIRQPAKALYLAQPTLEFWEGGSDEAPIIDTDTDYQPGDQLLSLALAHVARLVAGEMTVDEIRALSGLSLDLMALGMAVAKCSALEAQESDAQVRAITG